jgi:hypothetical protein
MKKIAHPGEQGDKEKTKQNEIHEEATPAGAVERAAAGYKSRVCPLRRRVVKRKLLPTWGLFSRGGTLKALSSPAAGQNSLFCQM